MRSAGSTGIAHRRNSDIVGFFRKAVAFTRRFPTLQRRQFPLGHDLDADGVLDIAWFGPDLGEADWTDPNARTLCFQLDSSEDGEHLDVERLYFILNGHYDARMVTLPQLGPQQAWFRAIDTSLPSGQDFANPGQEVRIDPPGYYIASPRSTVVLLAH